jgi:hypothetical protein
MARKPKTTAPKPAKPAPAPAREEPPDPGDPTPQPPEWAPIRQPSDVHILVLEYSLAGYWGKGPTLADALKNANSPRYYTAWLIHPLTVVTGLGDFSFPPGQRPAEFHSVKPKGKGKGK